MTFAHINDGRQNEAGRWDEIFIYAPSNFVPLVSTLAGRLDDFLNLQQISMNRISM